MNKRKKKKGSPNWQSLTAFNRCVLKCKKTLSSLLKWRFVLQYGRTALEVIMKCVLNINGEVTLVPTPSNYVGNFFEGKRF